MTPKQPLYWCTACSRKHYYDWSNNRLDPKDNKNPKQDGGKKEWQR